MTRIFLCDACTVFGISMTTSATIKDGKCEMSPSPCDNVRCDYYKENEEK